MRTTTAPPAAAIVLSVSVDDHDRIKVPPSTRKTNLPPIPLASLQEPPQKKTKLSTAVTRPMDLNAVGIASYDAKEYGLAVDYFFQAYCRVNTTASEIDHVVLKYDQSTLMTAAELCKIFSSDEKGENSNSTSTSSESLQKDFSHSRQHEYDEGMQVFCEPLEFSQTDTNMASAILVYNMALTHSRSGEGNYERALVWFRHAVGHVTEQGTDSAMLLVKIYHNVGFCLYRLGLYQSSLEYYRRALMVIISGGETVHDHQSSSSEEILAATKTSSPVVDVDRTLAAATCNCIGVLLFQSQASNFQIAVDMLKESLSSYKKATSESLIRTWQIQSRTATVLNNLGRVQFLRSMFPEALESYREALRIRKELAMHGFVADVDVAATLYNVAQTHNRRDEPNEAIQYYHEFLTLKNAVPDRDVATVYRCIAEMQKQLGNSVGAMSMYRKALKAFSHMSSAGDAISTEMSAILNKLGNVCYELKRYDSALKYYQRGLNMERKMLSVDHPHILVTLTNMAHVYKQQHEYEFALDLYEEVRDTQVDVLGINHIDLASTFSSIGLMQYHLHDYELSFSSYQEALRIRREWYGTEDHLDVASTLNSVGLVLFKQRVFDLAKRCFRESLRIRSLLLGADHRDVAILWYNLATVHYELRDDDEECLRLYDEALRIERNALGDDHPDVVSTLQHVGQVYQHFGLLEEARLQYETALSLQRRRAAEPSTSASIARILNLIGNLHLQQNNVPAMMDSFIEASRIYEERNPSNGNLRRSREDRLVVTGYNFYGLSKMHPPCASVA